MICWLDANNEQGSSRETTLRFLLNSRSMHELSRAPLTNTRYSPLRQHNFRQATLLVIDDQDDLWALIRFSRNKHFADVNRYWCASREKAMNYLTDKIAHHTSLPKLILQDLYLPEASLSLISDTRLLSNDHQQIPILVMSSSVAEADVRQAYQWVASFYIVKPPLLMAG